jgi:hypothetical protein
MPRPRLRRPVTFAGPGRFLAELNKQTASLRAGSNNNAPEYYDGVAIIDAAIQHANSTSGPAILKAIESLKNRSFISPQLKYTFSPTQHFRVSTNSIQICSLGSHGPLQLPVKAG